MTGYYQIENGILRRYTGREEAVEIPAGIHTIGEGALKGCVSLKKAVLPPGLRFIAKDAFKGCRRLEEIEIPDGVTEIGPYAFHRCHALCGICLPPSVQELGEYAFLYCDNLREAILPGVKRLGTEAFASGMSLEKLVISRELDPDCICDVFTGCGRVRELAYAGGETCSIPNVVEAAAGLFPLPPLMERIVNDILLRMMEWEGRILLRFRINIRHVEVPEGIEVLAKSSFFDMRGIQDIKLPKSLKRIESHAFRNCIGLEQVIFSGNEVEIAPDAFRNCTALRSVRTCDGAEYRFDGLHRIEKKEPENAGKPEPVLLTAAGIPGLVCRIHRQVLGNFRISGTILLKYLGEESRVIVPEGITRIAGEAFAGNETIDRVIFPESLREIGAEAFRGCLLMQTAALPKGLGKIGEGAFEGCVKLLRMEIPESVDVLEGRLFRQCRALQEICLPGGLKEIGESAFYGCQSLKKAELPEGLTTVGKMAFYRCGLREVRIPAKTESVGSLAFAKSDLQRAWIAGSGYGYGADIFGACTRLKSVVLEDGVRHIPDKLAFGCTALVRVACPQTLESVGRHVWEGSPFLERWRQRQKERQREAQERPEQKEPAEDAVFWDGQHLEGEARLPAHVRILAGGAFYGNTRITKVCLPETVYSVGAAAFKGCGALRQVIFPSKIRHLEAEVFSGCRVLEEVCLATGERENRLPAWRRIGARAFYLCEKLREVRLDQAVEIGREAFRGCRTRMSGAVNPALRAGEGAFCGTMLGEKTDNGLHLAGNLLVSGADCRGEVCLLEGIRGIAPYAFAGNRSLAHVTFPESLQWIGEGAFFGCSGLAHVAFSGELRTVEARAFEKCCSLREAECPACEIGEAAFAGCVSLVRAHLPKVAILEKRLFAGCANLKTCACGRAATVRDFCFSGCRSLTDFDFSSRKQIGRYAFSGCESLRYAEFADGLSLREYALEDCSGLEKLRLSGPEGTVSLEEYALSGCTSLGRIVYRGDEWAFVHYADLFSEEFPETVRLLFYSALSCFTVEQEENLVQYRGAAAQVRIPAGIRRIEAEVFRDVTMLERIEIPASVEYIGARAFHGTRWMERKRVESPFVTVRDMLLDASGCARTVEIPEDIRLICGWAFANGLEIRGIRFLSERVRVEEYAFRNCINLREIVLPDQTKIRLSGLEDRKKEWPPLVRQAVMERLNCFKTDEDGRLVECTGNISCLRLADGITEIGEGAFQDGNLLTEITFCGTVKKIGRRAFAGCKWLSEVRQAYGVERIEAHAFSDCGSLRRVELSDNLRHIGAGAFENCVSLEEIRIPEGVEEIPEKAFYRCQSLKQVRLASTVRRVGRDAFAYCGRDLILQAPEGVQIERRERQDELPEIRTYRT